MSPPPFFCFHLLDPRLPNQNLLVRDVPPLTTTLLSFSHLMGFRTTNVEKQLYALIHFAQSFLSFPSPPPEHYQCIGIPAIP